jgi:hypothetical protein
MKRKPKIPAKRAPMPEGYDGTTTRKQQGSPGLQAAGGVHICKSAIGRLEVKAKCVLLEADRT